MSVLHVSGMHKWGNAGYVLVSTQDFRTSLTCVEFIFNFQKVPSLRV